MGYVILLWHSLSLSYNYLKETILDYSGRWVLEACDNYNPYSGVTNNGAEGMNSKLKRLVEYKERQVDSIVLYLHYLHRVNSSFLWRKRMELTKQIEFCKTGP